jgi:hypothetical protein
MIVWTDYMRYRARLRRFDLDELERILRFSSERYNDEATGRGVAVGKLADSLVLIPFEERGKDLVPVTVHRTDRRQIESRLRSGRFTHV